MKLPVIYSVCFVAAIALPLAANDETSKDEYKIYSVVLEQLHVSPSVKQVVIGDKTTVVLLSDTEVWSDLPKVIELNKKGNRSQKGIWSSEALEKITPAVWSDFKSRNGSTAAVDVPDIRLSVKTVSVDQAALVTDNKSDYWGSFYTKFPDSPGLIMVSQVGFDHKTKQALVYVYRTCGWLCGDGYLVLLSGSHGGWTIVGKYLCWVS